MANHVDKRGDIWISTTAPTANTCFHDGSVINTNDNVYQSMDTPANEILATNWQAYNDAL